MRTSAQKWFVTHTASGLGFGLTLNFKRAADALLLAASFAVDWTQDADVFKLSTEFRRFDVVNTDAAG